MALVLLLHLLHRAGPYLLVWRDEEHTLQGPIAEVAEVPLHPRGQHGEAEGHHLASLVVLLRQLQEAPVLQLGVRQVGARRHAQRRTTL